MPSLLEEAIIDAQELKDAALKNAETTILEKYSSEIKDAVTQMLNEQPEELDLGLGEEDPLDAEALPAEGEDMGELPDAPLASTDGEKLCACPEQDEDIVVDFEKIAAQLQADADSGGVAGDRAQEPRETSIMGNLEEEVEITDESIINVLEELVADFEPQKSGWVERPSKDLEIAADELAASTLDEDEDTLEEESGDDELDEQVENYEARIKEVEKERNNSLEEIASLEGKNSEFRQLILKMKDRLDEVNTSNAKLLYTNRVLNSDSLNERQKNRLVEAIGNAQDVEEAKVIYETLQSAVGSTPKREPKSLSEAVNRNSSGIIPRKDTTRKADLAIERMKILAGIN